MITGDSLSPDLVLVLYKTTIYMLELNVGFESNIKVNSDRKADKYYPFLINLWTEYTNVNLFNLSMSAAGKFGTSSNTFLQMLNYLNFNQNLAHYIFMKASNIAVRDALIKFIAEVINKGQFLLYCNINILYLVSVSLLHYVIFAFSYCI